MATNHNEHAIGGRFAGVEGAAAEPALMDVRAVARLLDCSARHVYRLADAGKMPRPRHIGALVRWSRSEILSWIDDGCPAVRHTPGAKRQG